MRVIGLFLFCPCSSYMNMSFGLICTEVVSLHHLAVDFQKHLPSGGVCDSTGVTPEKMDDARWAYSSTHVHRAR